jgi:hypothetical protein
MPAWLQYILEMLIWAVALMSGILSILREALAIFAPDKAPQRSLFWNCVIIAFIISAAILWEMEHKKVNDLTTKLEQKQKNREISDKLASFIRQGLIIQNQCGVGNPLPLHPGKTPHQAYVQWDQEIDVFVTKNLSNFEVAYLTNVYDEIPKAFASEAEHTWHFVGIKIKRLENVGKKYEVIP